jgi:ATP-dependent helicase Lhr and Lhr-like helicase
MSDRSAFELLHRSIQRALWDMRWTELRPIQVDAIRAIFDLAGDLLISAHTAGGKTEAAFLPVLSRVVDASHDSIRVLYVGPLKALINDQFRRLEDLCDRSEIPVHRWHGDVLASKKKRLIASPSGVLLITPESIESLFINRSPHLAGLFRCLDFVVIDEVHAFMGTERGMHLLSLLSRIDQIRGQPPRRIGLSATIGAVHMACDWLRAAPDREVKVIHGKSERDLAVKINGYLKKARPAEGTGGGEEQEAPDGEDLDMAVNIFRAFRGTTNLIFGNRKAKLEYFADLLGQICKEKRCPREFLIHHGSLAKSIREDAEEQMRSGRPFTTFCTNTLELGIDIGYVDTIGQLDPPFSVSALAQRIGRSGRKEGETAKLRFFVQQREADATSPPWHTLFVDLLQAIAMVELMLEHWCEPPDVAKAHYSTLVQQILSVLAQTGGVRADHLFEVLIRKGAFAHVTPPDFAKLLRGLGEHDLIDQMAEGDIILGLRGQRIVNSMDIYAAFKSPDEYRVLTGGKQIATLPILFPIPVGEHVILAGRRWQVVERDDEKKLLLVVKARGAKPPYFVSGYGDIAPEIRQRMRRLLLEEEVPRYLDPQAQDLLEVARQTARHLGLAQTSIVDLGNDSAWFTWTGSKINRTLMLAARASGLEASDIGVGLVLQGQTPEQLQRLLQGLKRDGLNGEALADQAELSDLEKYDAFIVKDLLRKAYIQDRLDLAGAELLLAQL